MRRQFAKEDKVLGELPKQAPEEEGSYHDIDSDPDLKKIIFIRKKQKPKIDFEAGLENIPLKSSESYVDESESAEAISDGELSDLLDRNTKVEKLKFAEEVASPHSSTACKEKINLQLSARV